MKKAYAKPMLYAESFELVEHISKGCGVIASFGGDCQLEADGYTFFTSSEYGCEADAVSMMENAGYNPETVADAVKFFINNVQATCYNSLTDFNLMYIS